MHQPAGPAVATQPAVHYQEVIDRLRQPMPTSSLTYCHAKRPIQPAHAVSISIRSLTDVLLLSDVTQTNSFEPEPSTHCPIHPYEVCQHSAYFKQVMAQTTAKG